MSLVRYSKITEGFKREFLLLQGRGCAWRRCSFCDYHEDVSADPFSVNKEVLSHVTGEFGVLDIINSGSAMELDEATLDLTASIVREEQVHDLWFEAHWMYHMRLAAFAGRFPSCRVHFRCGVESFNGALRESWNKGMSASVTPEEVRRYFDGVCLLVGLEGQTREDVISSVETAERLFDYYSVNLFCPNSKPVVRDEALCRWFIEEYAPVIRKSPKAEVLIDNTDLGVG